MSRPLNRTQSSPFAAKHNPYARLYQALIRRAVQDLIQQEHQEEARQWLLSGDSDYAFATAELAPMAFASN
jgi:hypothetical protein